MRLVRCCKIIFGFCLLGESFSEVFCNVIRILPVVLGEWSEFVEGVKKFPKGIESLEGHPAAQFRLGPFESPDDGLYLSDEFMRAVEVNSEKIREKIIHLKMANTGDQRKTENKEISSYLSQIHKKLEGFENKKGTDHLDQKQLRSITKKSDLQEFKWKYLEFLSDKLKAIKDGMNRPKNWSAAIRNDEEKSFKFSNGLPGSPSEKFLKIWDNRSAKKKQQSKMIDENRIAGKNEFKSINNITNNNQYQIGNVFIFNRLSDEKGRSKAENFNQAKQDVEFCDESTSFNIKELLREILNVIKAVPDSHGTEGDHLDIVNHPLGQADADSAKEVKNNFYEMFHGQNLSLEQIGQMSRIIDFVERYHGTIGGLKNSAELTGLENGENIEHTSVKKNKMKWMKNQKGDFAAVNRRRKMRI